MRRKSYKLGWISYISKFFVLFFVFLALFSFSEKNNIKEKLVTGKTRYDRPKVIEIKTNIKTATNNAPTQSPFNWSVEKVDEHLTKISLPPDPRMSTPDELFEAMNNYRSSHNVSVLQKSDTLCSIAQNRANEQITNGGLDGHAGFEKYTKEQQEFSVMGEVLFGGAQPVYGVHIVEFGWDRSLTGHKEAIQDPSWQYGCGGIAGYYAVFIFGTK